MTALFFDGFATTWHGDSREESEPIGLSTNEIGKIVVDVARKGSGVGRALQDSTPEARDRRIRQCRLLATSLGRNRNALHTAGARQPVTASTACASSGRHITRSGNFGSGWL
jgi:hypothetical protein